jgi:hypothetical protein
LCRGCLCSEICGSSRRWRRRRLSSPLVGWAHARPPFAAVLGCVGSLGVVLVPVPFAELPLVLTGTRKRYGPNKSAWLGSSSVCKTVQFVSVGFLVTSDGPDRVPRRPRFVHDRNASMTWRQDLRCSEVVTLFHEPPDVDKAQILVEIELVDCRLPALPVLGHRWRECIVGTIR